MNHTTGCTDALNRSSCLCPACAHAYAYDLPLSVSRAEEGLKLGAASIAVHSGCLDLAEVLLTPLLERCRGGAGGSGGGGGGGGGGGPAISLASQLPVMQAVTQLHVAQVGALGRGAHGVTGSWEAPWLYVQCGSPAVWTAGPTCSVRARGRAQSYSTVCAMSLPSGPNHP